ncbi:MAG: aminotransferase class V-fold PLP-dependent enzyme, partial [Verrucomicrobia bacterium]|nr:aminotransferase class V-fold PLP-dependent enzyme [Verrucomicrobiota bacterium]
MNRPLVSYRSGRHFLQIPGPTNVPDRILRAIDRPTIDHRSAEFARLGHDCLVGMKAIFKLNRGHVFIYPASGTGAWEAAIVNTLSPGDRVLMFETGQFAVLWRNIAENFGLVVDFVPGDWRHGVDSNVVEAKLTEDARHAIKAVMCVHNETSTGVTSQIGEVR